MTPPVLPQGWTEGYIGQEAAAIEAIYRILLPDTALDLHLTCAAAPFWGAPKVLNGNKATSPGLIARRKLPGRDAGLTLRIGVPAPSDRKLEHSGPHPIPDRVSHRLLQLHPLLYETFLHLHAQRLQRRAFRIHPTAPVVRANPAPLAKVAARVSPAILIGVHWLEVGGAENLAFDCIRWALAAGLRVFVVACVPAPQSLACRLPDSPDLTFLRLDRYLDRTHWPEFVSNLIRAENIGIVHIHHCHALYDCLPVLKSRHAGVTVIDSTHIVEHSDGGFPRISGVWTRHIDHHHVISRDLAGFFQARFGTGSNVRLGRMLDRATTPARLPSPNLAAGAKRIGVAFVGRLGHQKRPVLVLETMRALLRLGARRGLAVDLTVLGDGPFLQLLQDLAPKRGMAGAIRFLPPDADVPALLAGSDFLILPSANEGLALVLYEAALNGCLPISCDVGAQAEMLPGALRVPTAPLGAVRGICRVIDTLTNDAKALAMAHAALQKKWDSIIADQTASEVLMPLYLAAAKGGG